MTRTDSSGDGDDADADPPSLSERVEASDDFRGALEQSAGLTVQYRRIVLGLVVVAALLALIVFAAQSLL